MRKRTGNRGNGRARSGPRRALPLAWALLFAAVAPLAGCVVGPHTLKTDASVPMAWHAPPDPHVTTQAPAENRWWQSFHDPVLDQLIELSTAQNLSLQVAGLRIAEARAQLEIAKGRSFPQVQFVFGGVTANGLTKQVANVTGLDRNILDSQLGFDAAWEVDLWGRYSRGVEAAQAGARASEAEYDAALVSLTAEVARTYVIIRSDDALLEMARKNVTLQEQGLAIALSRFRNGATSELDPTQAAALLENTRASVPRLQFDQQQARNALSTLLGEPPGKVEELLGGPRAIPVAPDTVAVGLPAELIRRRPDVRSAEEQAAAQLALVGVAKAELYPRFILVGTVGLEALNSGPTSHDLFSSDSFTYTVGPRITWPFFNYGRIENSVRVEDAKFEQLLANYRNTVLRALEEVEDAVTGYVSARQAMIFEQNSVQAAQRSAELSLVQYREGSVDFQRVLDSERSLLQQQNVLTQTSSSVATSLIALYKALGGGWEARAGRPLVPEQVQLEMRKRTGWGDLLSPPSVKPAANEAASGRAPNPP